MAKKKYDDPFEEYLNEGRDKQEAERKKLIIGGVASLAVVVALTGGTLLLLNNDKDDTPKDDSSSSDSNYMKKGDPNSQNTNTEANISQDLSLAENNDIDDKPEWLEKFTEKSSPISFDGTTWATQADKEMVDAVIASVNTQESDLYAASNMLPSEEAGFTSDDSKAVDETGFPNPMYSYWTQEQFVFDTNMILEMFTNPDVGEWGEYELPGSDPAKNFKATSLNPVLSSSLKEKIDNDGAKQTNIGLPLDWGNNEYGMAGQFPEFGYRWYGKVNGIKTQMKYDDSSSAYDVTLTADVTYRALLKNGGSIEKQGTLVLDLISGQKENVESSRKILVNNASLTMEE